MRQLLNYLTESEYVDSLAEMREDEYHLFGLDDDGVVTVAGVTLRTDFYDGRHRFVYNLVTREPRRPEDCGEAVMASLDEWAGEPGRESTTPESGLQREDACRFYYGLDVEQFCYSFRKGPGE